MGWGRRKLCNEEFDDLCVGKDNVVMDGVMGGNVTFMGVNVNRGNSGRAPFILNLGTK